MTIAFYEKRARQPLSAATLVLVDVCQGRQMEQDAVAAGAIHAILERCLTALETARRHGVPVVFVHDQRSDEAGLPIGESRWFSGFEPRRYESVVASKGPSCYASPYFSEILEGAGRSMLLAGLLGLEAAAATARDACRHGHRLTVLGDAVGFDSTALVRESLAPESKDPDLARGGGQDRLAVQAVTTLDWLALIAPATAQAARWQGTQLHGQLRTQG